MIKRRDFLKIGSLLGFLGISSLSFAEKKENKKVETRNKAVSRYDKNGNLIYWKSSNGIEYWYEYNKDNNEVHCKDSDSREFWYKYNENNSIIYSKNSFGWKRWDKYDKEGKKIETLIKYI